MLVIITDSDLMNIIMLLGVKWMHELFSRDDLLTDIN